MNSKELEELGKRLEPYYDLDTGEPLDALSDIMPDEIALYIGYKEAQENDWDAKI